MRSNYFLFYFLLGPLIALGAQSLATPLVSHPGAIQEPSNQPAIKLQTYQVRFDRCESQNQIYIVLRKFILNGIDSRLVVDPMSLKTSIAQTSALSHCVPFNLEQELESTSGEMTQRYKNVFEPPYPNYFLALKEYNRFKGQLQNHGLRSDSLHRFGTFFSVDLCPSVKPLDKNFFILFSQKKWPLAITVSGLWILRHPDDWKWLQNTMSHSPVLWVNHSLNHPFVHDLPLEQNFLLMEGRDVAKEILNNEQLMIKRGLTPSVFFRFPGLVANAQLLKTAQSLGVISLGSNAWLSKGEKPKPGSIVLMHGNGNDPGGLFFFEKYLKENKFSQPYRDILSVFSK